MIIKIQRPLMTNGDEPQALIYNHDRSTLLQVPLAEVEHLFTGSELKIYCKARLDDGKLVIGRKLPPQHF